jgi:serine protease Do
MHSDPHVRFRLCLAVTAMVAAGLACGPGGAATQAPEQPADTGGETGTGSVSDLEGVETATVQIEAQGTFVDPEFGLIPNAAGRGSGFLIDPSGLAVTNNHVVTGAALLKVWVGGESEPRNARVLGVSECADLAVIDIDGDGFPYLRWLQDPVSVGMDIYVAGFPLGDPQFTITRGVISKDEAGGETSWASVESTLEYDATTNPGNSGGPVVTPDGQVVGVHFAGNSSTRQAFGIASSYARGVVEELQFGRDVESIGVNGQAVMSEDGSISGIWVASVKSGSPADRAGMQPGDILTSMEGLFLATDGTMADYCDILRSHTASDTLSIEVLRYGSGEVLAGQLNGRELETTFSFENTLDTTVGDAGTPGGAGGYSGYVTVTDDFGAIQIDIPAEWTEVDGSAWPGEDGEVIGASIYAAANLDSFINSWSEPGVIFNVSDDLARLGGYVQLLDFQRERWIQQCELDNRYDYEDALYRGKFDVFENCGGPGGATYLSLTAVPIEDPTAFLILVEVQILSDADLDALEQILNTFVVIGNLP